MGTRVERAQSQTDLASKARSYQLLSEAVDGMDVTAVEETSRRVVDHVRNGNGPAFLEYRTYRFRAHSMFDAELYRDKSEVDEWKTRDPILALRKRLVEAGLADESMLAAVDVSVNDEVAKAVEYAERGSLEPVEHLLSDVYTPPGLGRELAARG